MRERHLREREQERENLKNFGEQLKAKEILTFRKNNFEKWMQDGRASLRQIQKMPYFKNAWHVGGNKQTRGGGQGVLAQLALIVGLLCVAKSGVEHSHFAIRTRDLKSQGWYKEFIATVDAKTAKEWADEFLACMHLAQSKRWGKTKGLTRRLFITLLQKVVLSVGAFPACLAAEAKSDGGHHTLLTPQLRTAFEKADEDCTLDERPNYDKRSGAAAKLRDVLAEFKLGTATPSN